MTKLRKIIYAYIIDDILEGYYGQTDFYARRQKRDVAGRKLWKQLPKKQRLLLEEVQRAYDLTQ